MIRESLKGIWNLSYHLRMIRLIGVQLSWRRKPAAYESSDGNGFILTDVVIAAVIGVLCLVPAVRLAAQAVLTYKQAQYIVGAAVIGRSVMENLRSRQDVHEETGIRTWNGVPYTVLTRIEYTGDRYVRYFVEVKDENGTVRQYVSLSAAE